MLGQYKSSEAEFIDIRVALPHEGEDGLFFTTASCGSQHDVEMTNAWIGPDFPDTIPNTQHMPPVVELLANMIDGKIQKITDTIISQEEKEYNKYKPYLQDSGDLPDTQDWGPDYGNDANWGSH
jgi:hypothetical protein